MKNNIFTAHFKRHLVAGLVFVLSVASTREVLAQEQSSIEVATGVSELPKLSEPGADGVPTYISGPNAVQYRQGIAPEFYSLVRSGTYQLNAFSRLNYQYSYGDDWDKQSQLIKEDNLTSLGILKDGVRLERRFLFGDQIFLKGERDAAKLGTKIVWNGLSASAQPGILQSNFKVYWYRDDKYVRTLSGIYGRAFPSVVDVSRKGIQLFREFLNFTSPSILSKLRYLTIRFIGPDEDLLWINSPALDRARQLAGSTRTDAVARTPLSLDDIFVWNGKAELVNSSVTGIYNYFVPFLGLDPLELLSADGSCGSVKNVPSQMSLLDHSVTEGRQPWSIFSTLVTVAPRWVYRLELAVRDPFSLYGRQILYVDAESMQPVMKLVYNRTGQLWKQVIGALTLVKSGNRNYPLTPIVLINDYSKHETVLHSLSLDGLKLCEKENTSINLSNFELTKIFPNIAERAKQNATFDNGNSDQVVDTDD